jgi:NADPH:quinone reductase
MRAVLINAYAQPDQFVIEELPPKHSGIGRVVIGVKACGANFLDSLMVQGMYLCPTLSRCRAIARRLRP